MRSVLWVSTPPSVTRSLLGRGQKPFSGPRRAKWGSVGAAEAVSGCHGQEVAPWGMGIGPSSAGEGPRGDEEEPGCRFIGIRVGLCRLPQGLIL